MFTIHPAHRQRIIDHALSLAPIEACGVIVGRLYEQFCSDRIIGMDNVAEEWGTSFEFDPQQQMAVWNDVEARGEVIRAVYHSHTKHAAYPSARDIVGAAAVDPLTKHIIVSVASESPEVRVFSIVAEQVTEIEWSTEDD